MEIYENEEVDVIAEMEWLDIPVSELWKGWDDPPPYQRPFSLAKAKDVLKKYTPVLGDGLIVSARDTGQKVTVDGRHRLWVAHTKDVEVLRCKVLYGLTIEEEARLFKYANTNRANPRAIDVFQARLIEKEPSAIRIRDICTSCGFAINKNNAMPCATKAVVALDLVYKRDGTAGLRATLDVIGRTWPEEPRNGEANLIHGIANLLRTYGKGDDGLIDKLVKKLQTVSIEKLLRDAKTIADLEGGSARKAMSDALVHAYNKGKRVAKLE